jgi:hypothetical protein
MMRNVQAIQQIEQSNSDELVELAIEGKWNGNFWWYIYNQSDIRHAR